MDKVDAIFFVGPQGSGKGTQARKLSEKLGFFYWEMGAVLRQESLKETDLGRKIKQLIDAGVLLPDDLLLEVFKQRMNEIPLGTGVIFDGVPRRVGQANFVLDVLRGQGRNIFITVFLDVPREESLSRLLKRAEVEHRVDDTKETIEFRLDQYYQDTSPMLEIMRQQTKLMSVNGMPPVEEVTVLINNALELPA